jgi:hypothetical protein
VELKDLTPEEQSLVMAFAEIAKDECGGRGWDEVEEVLASCWENAHGEASHLNWVDIAMHIRAACEEHGSR